MNKDAIGPIRSFSGSPETTEPLRSAQPPSVRTRGPIRSRISPAEGKHHLLTVETLFEQIRAEVNGLPLTIIIHGWGDKAAEDFRFLSLRLLTRDALWFIPSRNRRVTRAAPAKE